ncbi:ABC transporter ATP-binding protein [Labrenzia sp. PHM005]|uniref:ABC transporter ATP-binding protein n=1 Tax=Labrenzia sp. PHM005 TaxID=2590016 RepID=UPI00113FD200|nr:ABC transporter ATP-binding protein [Labrenzia sp. PHM005]QDG76339.1 ABC transporter ATP-binding protein [Labrenzia sp. PHM005]
MTDQNAPVLSISNLSIGLPVGGDRLHAVEDLSLEIHPREIVCIVGESGSGKSVTSFATMGLLPKILKPTSGEIRFDGRDLLSVGERERSALRGDKMAMIFQEPMTALNPCYTVGDQIEEVFAAHRKMKKADQRARTLELLREVHLPEPERLYGCYPHQLSGGQRQRVMIAMALALDPKLLIADEPTTALDVTTQAQILHLIKELKANHNAGIMFVTHDFDVVAEIADRVVVMKHGRIVEQGFADEVLNRPQHPYTKSLINAVPRKGDQAPADLDEKPNAMIVEGLEKTFHSKANFFKSGRTVHAVKDASFAVRKGETIGIVGESGSGKTTLVRCLIRLLDPDTGQIQIGDYNFAELTRTALRPHRKDMQIVFQDPYGSLNPRRTIGDLLIEGPCNFGVSRKEALERAKRLLKIVRMDEDALNRYPAQFSGGQRQRICIARALAVEPKILIADEAVSALDVSVQKEVLNLLRDIRDEFGLTILFITHDLRVAAQICDNILVMKNGEIVERGSVDAVFGNPQHDYTKTLLAAQPGQNWTVPTFSDTELELSA